MEQAPKCLDKSEPTNNFERAAHTQATQSIIESVSNNPEYPVLATQITPEELVVPSRFTFAAIRKNVSDYLEVGEYVDCVKKALRKTPGDERSYFVAFFNDALDSFSTKKKW